MNTYVSGVAHGHPVTGTAGHQQREMNQVDNLGPEMALAFSCLAAVGSSMVRRFRIEDAKSCTRICRRILLCAANPPPSDVNNDFCPRTCIDAITAATTLLTRRLSPLDEIDTKYLSTAEAAIAFLCEYVPSDPQGVIQ